MFINSSILLLTLDLQIMPQLISKIKDEIQFVFLRSCFVGHPVAYKRYLWQTHYDKHIMANISWQAYYGKYIMANVLWQMKRSPLVYLS